MASRPETPFAILIGFAVLFFLSAVAKLRQNLAREKMMATVKRKARRRRTEIGGQPVEYWLELLNQEAAQPIIATETMVLMYQGQEFFFVVGGIYHLVNEKSSSWKSELNEGCFLIAVGESAVRLLSEQKRVFRLITGSTELAIFAVFRQAAFTQMLVKDNKQ
jgi:hypothetical protein